MKWLFLIFLCIGSVVSAHSTREAIADLTVQDGRLLVEVYSTWEPYILGMNLDGLSNTDDSPMAAEYDALRAESDDVLAALIKAKWSDISADFFVSGAGALQLDRIEVDPETNLEIPRDARVYMSAPLSQDGRDVTFGWAKEYGPLILRASIGNNVYAELLEGGTLSAPISLTTGVQETPSQAFLRFVYSGIEHIIPRGLDHILFVLGLFFFALRWGPLLGQVTTFTLAHTLTLGLATLGYISIPDDWMWLVETFIALSISYIAVENILRPKLGWWRIFVVFSFGLLHGLGFASVLGDVGLVQGQFLMSLLGFNIGVEVGQLSVIVAAFFAISLSCRLAQIWRPLGEFSPMIDMPVMFRCVSVLGSVLIGVVGLYWVYERAVL